METNVGTVEKSKSRRVKELFFAILILVLSAVHIIVMLQSAGIIRADR